MMFTSTLCRKKECWGAIVHTACGTHRNDRYIRCVCLHLNTVNSQRTKVQSVAIHCENEFVAAAFG